MSFRPAKRNEIRSLRSLISPLPGQAAVSRRIQLPIFISTFAVFGTAFGAVYIGLIMYIMFHPVFAKPETPTLWTFCYKAIKAVFRSPRG
jgi:hypothetical protein